MDNKTWLNNAALLLPSALTPAFTHQKSASRVGLENKLKPEPCHWGNWNTLVCAPIDSNKFVCESDNVLPFCILGFVFLFCSTCCGVELWFFIVVYIIPISTALFNVGGLLSWFRPEVLWPFRINGESFVSGLCFMANLMSFFV